MRSPEPRPWTVREKNERSEDSCRRRRQHGEQGAGVRFVTYGIRERPWSGECQLGGHQQARQPKGQELSCCPTCSAAYARFDLSSWHASATRNSGGRQCQFTRRRMTAPSIAFMTALTTAGCQPRSQLAAAPRATVHRFSATAGVPVSTAAADSLRISAGYAVYGCPHMHCRP